MTTISHKISIKATPADVRKAITSVDGLKGWFSPAVDGQPAKGGEVKLNFTEAEGPFHWKVSEPDGDAVVRWECTKGPGKATGTIVTFRMSAAGGKTVVDLDHEGFEGSDEKVRTCNTMWGGLLTHLKKYVETSEAKPAIR